MDWGNVKLAELVNALKEVEWTTPPRPLAEFFAKFAIPKTRAKWESRVKCNLYYYRTNYFLSIAFILCIGFIRNPLAFIAVLISSIGTACLNDSFALSVNERLTRAIRRLSPPLASKMRPPTSVGVRGRPLKGNVYICGTDRRIVVLSILSLSALFWYISSAFKTVLYALALGFILTLLHMSLRTPNLKARLNAYREEFRAGWRGLNSDP
ncbi:hypothetical protein SELMODRAFT_141259 [Selaginella moellendorffii]|uniref:PRA1 family protein n=1 Tax=Selaginella moellendorffii TaxID=88036 RepID=D8QV72_SELML|nr:PRA1 family protein A1 [Selaginella moellendorffii]EFJ36001.1 hypothetical protein SELMODRAFT_141259 [Selaginella moellendorffii]|eukprot:XP_024518342.1 PRA1 family protein A1 [Selaginella moellendorffii]